MRTRCLWSSARPSWSGGNEPGSALGHIRTVHARGYREILGHNPQERRLRTLGYYPHMSSSRRTRAGGVVLYRN